MIISITHDDITISANLPDDTYCDDLMGYIANLVIMQGYAIGSVIDALESAASDLREHVKLASERRES